jgi:ribonuclease HII
MAFIPLNKFVDQKICADFSSIYGIDEVGRGPWAGPVVACAVSFREKGRIHGIDDSKKLTAAQRESLYEKLIVISHYGVGVVDNELVDKLGLREATNLAFIRALEDLKSKAAPAPKFLLVDGRDRLKLPYPFKTIIKGDSKVKIIAAASIIAKVVRDRLMCDLARDYPEYGFEIHKGYGTGLHQKNIEKHGLCNIHRKSFKPIADLFQTSIF